MTDYAVGFRERSDFAFAVLVGDSEDSFARRPTHTLKLENGSSAIIESFGFPHHRRTYA